MIGRIYCINKFEIVVMGRLYEFKCFWTDCKNQALSPFIDTTSYFSSRIDNGKLVQAITVCEWITFLQQIGEDSVSAFNKSINLPD